MVITASGVSRGTKLVPLKRITDQALELARQEGHHVVRVLVYEKSALQREVGGLWPVLEGERRAGWCCAVQLRALQRARWVSRSTNRISILTFSQG